MVDQAHHDVNKQMKIVGAMHDAYADWSQAKRSKKNSDVIQSLHDKYVDLKDQINYYTPDPDAKF